MYIKQVIKKQEGDDQEEAGRSIKTLKVLRDRCPKESISTGVLILLLILLASVSTVVVVESISPKLIVAAGQSITTQYYSIITLTRSSKTWVQRIL